TRLRRPHDSTRFPYTTLFRSRHRYGKVRQWLSGRHCWADIEPFQAICLLARELYALSGGMVPELRKLRELEFLHRLTDSYGVMRSEEHTSELQSREKLVCRLL